jgi:hypothetical protein
MGNGWTASQKDAGQPVNAYGFWRIQFLVGSGSDLAIEPTTDGASSSRGVYPWRETGLVTVFVPPTVIRAAGDSGSVCSKQGVAIAKVLVNDIFGSAIASSASVVPTAFNSSNAGVSFNTSNGAI